MIPEILINAEGIPLHAGIAFGAGVAIMLWLWANRDPGKCLLAMALTLMGWLAAVNTANDVMSTVVSSELFGTVEGAKASREIVGWVLAGLVGGAIGGGLTAFGAGIAAQAIRRPEAWGLIVGTGALIRPAALSGRKSGRDHASLRAVAGRGGGLDCLWSDPGESVNLDRSGQAMRATSAGVTSSVTTLKPASVWGPNEVTIATSVASRPRAIRMRPMRGSLCRASNVYQRSPI